MGTELQANHCVAYVADGVVYVGFCDHEFEARAYLLLQRTLAPGAQDVSLGLDQVHITFCDQVRSAYGGILQFRLGEGSADILLDSQTAGLLGTKERVHILLPPKGLDISTLRRHLQLMFRDASDVLVLD